MKNIILIIFLIQGMISQLWSQETIQIEMEKKLVSHTSERLFRSEMYKSDNAAANIRDYIFTAVYDTINKYDKIRTGIINKACDFIGVSYRYGQSSEKGFDCSGYVKFIYQIFGVELPHSSYTQYKISRPVETAEARSGDLVFFITRGKRVSHVGIYLGNNQFIHSPGRGKTVSINSLDAGYYNRRLVGFGSVL